MNDPCHVTPLCKLGKYDFRCLGSSGTHLWAGDRSSTITVRDPHTGKAVCTLKLGSGVFANSLVLSDDCMCVACTDGRLRLYCKATFALKREYDLNQTLTSDSVTCAIKYGVDLFAGCESGQVYLIGNNISSLCSAASPVTCLAARPGVLYLGTEAGHVASVPVDCPHGMIVQKVHKTRVSSLLWSWKANTMWVGAGDGRVTVLDASAAKLEPLATLTQHYAPERSGDSSVSLTGSSGCILSGGANGDIIVWNAAEKAFAPPMHGMLAHLPQHAAPVRLLQGVQSTTAKLWSYSADRCAVLLELNGFLDEAPEVLSRALQDADNLGRKVVEAENNNKEASAHAARVEFMMKEAREKTNIAEERTMTARKEKEDIAGEKSLIQKELSAMKTRLAEAEAANRTLLEKNGALEVKLLEAEQEIRRKETTLSEDEKKFKTLKLECEKRVKEVEVLNSKVKQLDQRLADKTKSVQSFTKQLTDSKDEVLRKDVQLKKIDSEKKEMDKTLTTHKATTAKLENQVAMLEGNVKNLKETLLVKTNEITELTTSRDTQKSKANKVTGDLETAIKVIETEAADKRSVADAAVLARNEVELLRREREELMNRATYERSYGMDSEEMVMKLKGQLSQLHEALEGERMNNKTLEDQYTIFQFVISSRGELVTAIWFLNDQVKRVKQDLKQLTDSLKNKQQDKEPVLIRAVQESLQLLDDKAVYIVANYFTEYEKLHLGISSYHYYPDTNRPQVVGDKLLTKLKQVTPSKQYRGLSPRHLGSPEPIRADSTVPFSPFRTPAR